MNGYFKIHRSLFKSTVWIAMSHLQRVVLITMLGMACWKETEVVLNSGKKIKLTPGQFVATTKDIENACNNGNDKSITRKVVRGAIEQLKNNGFAAINRASGKTNDGYVVTIVNWPLYQVEEKNEGQQQGHQQDQRRAIKQSFQGHPTLIKEKREEGEEIYIPPYNPPTEAELSTSNNDEQQKKPEAKRKAKKVQYAEFVWLTEKQYDELLGRLKSQEAVDWCIAKLDSYKASKKGRATYRDDYKAVLRWVIDAYHEMQNRTCRQGPSRQKGVQPDVYEMALKAQKLLDGE